MSADWAKAFASAQADMPKIATTKTANVGQYSYKYADLPVIFDAVRPVLGKYGLAVAQNVETESGRVSVTTRIYHASGHVEEFGPLVLPAGNTAQTAGSAITYARRYALCAALGIAADEDDDGTAASKNSAGSEPVPAKARGSEPQAAKNQAGTPPKHSRGGADAATQTPVETQAVATPAPSLDKSQSGGVSEQGGNPIGEVGATTAPPAAELWNQIQDAVDKGLVSKTKVHMAAARLCTEHSKPVPTKYPDVKDCDGDILQAIATQVAA